MRFIEFADTKPYTVSVDDTGDSFDQLKEAGPKRSSLFALRKATCNSYGADRVTQPSRRRRSSVLRLRPHT